MFEIEIKDAMYQFNFGIGFMRDADKGIQSKPDQNGVTQNLGLRYMIAGIMDGDCNKLSEALLLANKGFVPRLKGSELDAYIDDENTDIDKLFDDVLGFLRTANATKKMTVYLEKAMKEEEEKQKAQMEA